MVCRKFSESASLLWYREFYLMLASGDILFFNFLYNWNYVLINYTGSLCLKHENQFRLCCNLARLRILRVAVRVL